MAVGRAHYAVEMILDDPTRVATLEAFSACVDSVNYPGDEFVKAGDLHQRAEAPRQGTLKAKWRSALAMPREEVAQHRT